VFTISLSLIFTGATKLKRIEKVDQSLKPDDEALVCDLQKKSFEQHFHVVLGI